MEGYVLNINILVTNKISVDRNICLSKVRHKAYAAL